MIFARATRFALLLLAAGILLMPQWALGCAACYGKSDSELAQGFNWGIFSLLAVVGCVLGGISGFFIYIAKRSTKLS